MPETTSVSTARRSASISLLASFPTLAFAPGVPGDVRQPGLVWRGAAAVLVLGAIWVVLYKVVYPYLVRYYHPDDCKAIFWTQFWLYAATVAYLSLYWVVAHGFAWPWSRWLALVLAALWFVALLVFTLRPARA